MGARRPNPKLAKIHRSYSVEEVATLYGVHRNTVRAWLKQGLEPIDQQRPLLIQGSCLAAFLKARRTRNKRPCKLGEIYCVRCREPRRPANDAVHYGSLTPTMGNLIGLCPNCDSRMFRRTSFATLPLFAEVLSVTLTKPLEHIGESPHPSENCDLEQEARTHGNAQPT